MARGYNPFAPLGPKQISRQARQYVSAQISPVIAQLNRQFAQQNARGQAGIAGYTNQLANALAPMADQTRANYSRAEQEQQTINTALANRLNSAGGTAAAELEKQGFSGGTAAAIGAGASNAGYAQGSAALSALLSQGAAAQQYSAAQPGIARLGGLQQAGRYRAQIESERSNQVGAILAKEPGLVAQTVNDLNNRELQKGIAVQSGLVSQAKLQQSQGQFNQRQGQQVAEFNARESRLQHQANVSNSIALKRLGLSQQSLNLALARENRLRATAGKKKGGFTPVQVSHFKATAIDTAHDLKHGVPAVLYSNGNVKTPATAGRSRADGLRYLVNHGVPYSISVWAINQTYGKPNKATPGVLNPKFWANLGIKVK